MTHEPLPLTAAYRVVATGLRSPEGPVVLDDGSVALVESLASRVIRVDPEGNLAVIAITGDGPNGLAIDQRGGFLVANNGGIGHPIKGDGRLQRITAKGSVEDIAVGLDAPNDVCVAPDGDVWFTDPRDSWYRRDLRPGRVWRISDGELTLEHEGLSYPNGIGFSPLGALVVAESRTGWLHSCRDGQWHPWARVPGAPDGFAFDAEGRCFVCCFDVHHVHVIDTDGRLIDALPLEPGAMPTNCAIGRGGELVVTESAGGRLIAFDLGLVPAALPSHGATA